MSAVSPQAGAQARLAIIAGSGRFPFEVAQEARRQGVWVAAVGLSGWVDPSLAAHVDHYEELAVGELGKLIQRLRDQAIVRAVMVGKVTKGILFDGRVSFDPETLAILSKVKDYSVNGLLGAVAARLGECGITLLDSAVYLQDAICREGVLTRRGPTPEEQADIRFGFKLARAMAEWDVGQSVVVKRSVVAAVEAMEGTDAAIRRAHALAGKELVVVKTASAKQDRRFDLPVIGPDTLRTARESGVSCIAMEAGATVLLSRVEIVREADEAGMCLIGVRPDADEKTA